jgi:hypothetical protein
VSPVDYVIEEELGGYVKNGDIEEWVWKDAPKDEPPAEEKKATKKAKKADA